MEALFVGGPRDGQTWATPPLQDELVVLEAVRGEPVVGAAPETPIPSLQTTRHLYLRDLDQPGIFLYGGAW